MTTHSHADVKRVGDTGQVSVGKGLAGRLVRVEPTEEGVFLRFVVDVAEQDAWWTMEPHKTHLIKALAWAADHPPAETDLRALLKAATSSAAGKKKARAARKSTRRPSKKA
jgi:hypothetical protein